MKLHEYQAKEIFRGAGVPVPNGVVASSPEEAAEAVRRVKGPPWVVKAQVHAGGRGQGGGVKVVGSSEEAVAATGKLLGAPLVTKQTGPRGVRVNQVLIEEGMEIDRELYLGMVIDRTSACPAMIFSPSGGMDIEAVAVEMPERIFEEGVDPATGWMPFQGRNLAYALDPLPEPAAVKGLMQVMQRVYEIFMAHDCSLVEINPLVITGDGKVVALDAKLTIDDNALFRQKNLLELDDPREKDPLELMAERHRLNYIRLDGNVGAMVNGAGLAMATMDVIKMAGADPANFLDVGGGATEEMITSGFEIILADERVKAILINIFGGILRCDVLARGVVAAARKTGVGVPLIVRLEGTNVEEGRAILKASDLKFLVAHDLADAAQLVSRNLS